MYKSFLSSYLDAYIQYRNASGRGNATDDYILKVFDNFCFVNYPDAKELSDEIIKVWTKKRETELNKSWNDRVRPVRSFIKYLNDRKLADIKFPDVLKPEKTNYIPHFFTESELKSFFNACDSIELTRNTLGLKLKKITVPVLFRLLYSSGIRTTEARFLTRKNVDYIRGVLNIEKSKGYDQHYVALDNSILALLKQYDEIAQKLKPNRLYFFENENGTYYSDAWLSRVFRESWIKANNNVEAVAYDLRHNYAIENINRWQGDNIEFDKQLFYLSKSMGHRCLKSTLYYYSITPRLAEKIKNKTEKGFNEIFSEVKYEEKE